MKKGFTPYVIASNTCSERSVGTKVARQSQSGFTLMELLVYMMIVGIIVIVAGQAFSNSTKFRVRTQNMLKATQEAENIATLFKADVAQMGAKSSKEGAAANGDDNFVLYTDCATGAVNCLYMDPNNSTEDNKDSSSYSITGVEGYTDYDKLTIRRVRYDASGLYQALEQVEWTVDGANKVLKRSCKLLRKATTFTYDANTDPCSDVGNNATPVEMATGVEKFRVYPGIPEIRSTADANHQNEQLFPAGTIKDFKLLDRGADDATDATVVELTESLGEGGESVTITGFVANRKDANGKTNNVIDVAGVKKNEVYVAPKEDDADTWNSHCQQFTLEPGIEYEISFSMTYGSSSNNMLLFVAGRDHMAVGFRKTDGTKPDEIEDFLFYPPTNEESQGKRVMRFTVPQQVANVCMAFTFAIYSPTAATGSVTISGLKFRRVAGATYTFDKNESINTKDKKNVKALKMELQIGRGGKNSKKGETGEATIVVPTPSNGPRN